MADRRLEQFVELVKKTREDLQAEAQRLLEEIKDPEKQQRVKEGVKELGSWARQTAEELTDIVDRAVRKAEGALSDAAARVGVKVPTRAAASQGKAEAKTEAKKATRKKPAAAKSKRKKKA